MTLHSSKFTKVTSPDKKIWYGTFKTKEVAEEYMKKQYPNEKYITEEVEGIRTQTKKS